MPRGMMRGLRSEVHDSYSVDTEKIIIIRIAIGTITIDNKNKTILRIRMHTSIE